MKKSKKYDDGGTVYAGGTPNFNEVTGRPTGLAMANRAKQMKADRIAEMNAQRAARNAMLAEKMAARDAKLSEVMAARNQKLPANAVNVVRTPTPPPAVTQPGGPMANDIRAGNVSGYMQKQMARPNAPIASVPTVPITPPVPMKKGGKVGSASKRADGIAQRGKTRGKYI